MLRRYYEEIINYLLKGTFWKGATDAERNVIRKRSAKYKVINGVLYHKGKGRGIEDLRLVATSKADQQNAIRMCHVSESDDQHFGINKTASLLASRFYWRMMYTDVIQYSESCPKCQKTKGTEIPVPPPVAPVEEKLWVWRMLEVQVLEKFQVNGKKVYHLLRIVDVHSNWTTFSFLEDSSERTAVRTLFRECSMLGFPQAFRFVHSRADESWINMFVSALHQELDGFGSICGQEVDTSIHVVIEDRVPEWKPEQCLDTCQQMILSEPAALYVFFGNQSLVEPDIHDWYLDQVNQFVKKEPFWWPNRLSAFMFHLRNSLPPGMTTSPASVLASGDKGNSHLFLPFAPEKEEPEVTMQPVVAQPVPKEFLAESCFHTGKVPPKPVKPTVDASAQTKNNHKETSTDLPTSESQPVKRKSESKKSNSSSGTSSSNKRLHHSSKSSSGSSKSSSSSSLPVRTREEQQKIDEGIKEAQDVVISKAVKDLEKVKKKKKKKHSKKNNDHTNSKDMFEMLPPIVLPPRRSPGLDMAMSSGMSSLEALKAVTGTSLPQSVPPSPLLPSAMLSPTTPEENSPAPPQEEASPGRYSFRQNLKPKGTSNFIRRLIAKTSSKRYTGVQNPETSDSQPQWQPSPPKKSKRHHKLRSSHTPSPGAPPPTTSTTTTPPPIVKTVQSSTSLSTSKQQERLSPPIVKEPEKNEVHSSFSPSSLTLELSATSTEDNSSPNHLKQVNSTPLEEDFEPACNLRLTRAEEELIDQTIKGVDENGFMDADRMVGDAVLAVEEISKDELSGMEVDSDAANSSTPNTTSVLKTDLVESVDQSVVNNLYSASVKGSAATVTNGSVLESYQLSESGVQDDSTCKTMLSDTEHNDLVQKDTVDKMGIVSFVRSSSEVDENQILLEQSADCDMVNENVQVDVDIMETTKGTEIVEEHESNSLNHAVDISMSETSEVCTTEVSSDVIFDVLDTCETYEVGEKKSLEDEISENTEDSELERLTEKISRDLASGLTTDKTKTAQAQHCPDVDNADTDEYSIMVKAQAAAQAQQSANVGNTDTDADTAACQALLYMASAVTNVNNQTVSVSDSEPVCTSETQLATMNETQLTVSNAVEMVTIVQECVSATTEGATGETIKVGTTGVVLEVIATDDAKKQDATETEAVCATEETATEEVSVKEPAHTDPTDASTTDEVEDESELCLPSDFFIDEAELVEIPTSRMVAAEEKVEKSHGQIKIGADQDIVSILNSIMSNRAFLDDPVARVQREKEDRHLKELHGLRKDVKIKMKAIAELVVQRASLGPVPVRTIRNNERRAYYIGNIKIDEFNTPMGPQVTKVSPFGIVKPQSMVVKRARVHLPKVSPMGPMKPLASTVKLLPPTKPEISKPESGGSGRSTPQDMKSVLKITKRQFLCPICPRTYVISQEMLDLHIAFHIDNARNLHCPVCGKAGTFWTAILKHYLGHQESKNNASLYEMILATCDKDRKLCGQCNTMFAMRNALINHLQSTHIGEKVNGSIKHHLMEVIKAKEPPVPEAMPVTATSPETKDISYLCPNCPYSTKTHYNLILHGHECQGNVQKMGDSLSKILDDLTPQFKCSLCGYCGVSSKQLEQHMRRLHHGCSNAATPKRSSAKVLECKYACDFCMHKFRTSAQLRSHLLKHKEATMYHCKACSYKCRYKKIMHRHAHKVHPNVSLKGLIQAPKKLNLGAGLVGQPKVQQDSDEDMKESEEENASDEAIPTATVVVHTDENGELTVCDETEVSTIDLQPEQTTYLLDSSTLDTSTVTLDGSAVTLDGSAVTLDGSAVTLDGSVTLDGNVLQLLQGDSGDCNGQPKVLFLSVGPSELESFNSSTFTIAEQNSSS